MCRDALVWDPTGEHGVHTVEFGRGGGAFAAGPVADDQQGSAQVGRKLTDRVDDSLQVAPGPQATHEPDDEPALQPEGEAQLSRLVALGRPSDPRYSAGCHQHVFLT